VGPYPWGTAADHQQDNQYLRNADLTDWHTYGAILDPEKNTLTYTFVEILSKKYIFYFVRFLGGAFFLSGMCLMAYNCWKTVAGAKQPAAQLQTQPA